MDEKAAVRALGALAQDVRLRIYRAVVGVGPDGMTPGALARELAVPPSTVSFHVKELLHAGLLTQARNGRHLIYRPSLDTMNQLLAYLSAHCCQAVHCTPAPAAAEAACTKAEPPPHATFWRSLMSDKVYNVLFVCTHNSARSIMAEGILNSLGQGRFQAFSAGSHPGTAVNPLALHTLSVMHIPTVGYRSKDWNEFARPGAPGLDFVFTVCDKAAGEVCPLWPGQPMTAHWGVADPSAFEGSDEHKTKVFWDTAVVLKRRIELMLALPMASLDRMALQREIRDIGTR
jgi:arsenate reductase